MRTRSLWNYYRDKIDDVNDYDSDRKPFKYKTKNSRKNPTKPNTTATNSCKIHIQLKNHDQHNHQYQL